MPVYSFFYVFSEIKTISRGASHCENLPKKGAEMENWLNDIEQIVFRKQPNLDEQIHDRSIEGRIQGSSFRDPMSLRLIK